MIAVIHCLLDSNNPIAAGGSTIGGLITASGKEHLWEDRPGAVIDTIVIHSMSAAAVGAAEPFNRGLVLKLFCDYGVSSHYLIERDGTVLALVPEEKKAWHAGGSIMPEPDNRRRVNDFSIGVELAATPDSGFTAEQYRSLAELCADIERRRAGKFAYVGHEQVAGRRAVDLGLRQDVKVDPGVRFDWSRLFELLETRRLEVKT